MTIEQRVELLEKEIAAQKEATKKQVAALRTASAEAAICLVENLKQTP
ncbi:hypothetical protein [Citrobacter sp. wls829]|nr:hypothetical protein [Citrobacter sp. wls829]